MSTSAEQSSKLISRRRGRLGSRDRNGSSTPRFCRRRSSFPERSASFGAEPNAQVSFIDAAMPGMLPVINRPILCRAGESVTGLGLRAKNQLQLAVRPEEFISIPTCRPAIRFSQYKNPIVGEGEVLLDLPRRGRR